MDTYHDPNKEPINVLAAIILRAGFIILIVLAVCGLPIILAVAFATGKIIPLALAICVTVVVIRHRRRGRRS